MHNPSPGLHPAPPSSHTRAPNSHIQFQGSGIQAGEQKFFCFFHSFFFSVVLLLLLFARFPPIFHFDSKSGSVTLKTLQTPWLRRSRHFPRRLAGPWSHLFLLDRKASERLLPPFAPHSAPFYFLSCPLKCRPSGGLQLFILRKMSREY